MAWLSAGPSTSRGTVSVVSSSPRRAPLSDATAWGVVRAGDSWVGHGKGDARAEKSKRELRRASTDTWRRCDPFSWLDVGKADKPHGYKIPDLEL